MLREATAMNVRQNLGELLDGVQYRHDNVVITKAGKPVAALVDMATYERMRRKDDGEFQQVWAKLSKGFEDMSQDELEELVSFEVKAVRAEMHAERKKSAT